MVEYWCHSILVGTTIFSSSKICSFVSSIFSIIIFSAVYLYLIYFSLYLITYFSSNFSLYLSLDNLKDLFSNDGFNTFGRIFLLLIFSVVLSL